MITSYLRWLASLTFGMMVPVFHYSIFLATVCCNNSETSE